MEGREAVHSLRIGDAGLHAADLRRTRDVHRRAGQDGAAAVFDRAGERRRLNGLREQRRRVRDERRRSGAQASRWLISTSCRSSWRGSIHFRTPFEHEIDALFPTKTSRYLIGRVTADVGRLAAWTQLPPARGHLRERSTARSFARRRTSGRSQPPARHAGHHARRSHPRLRIRCDRDAEPRPPGARRRAVRAGGVAGAADAAGALLDLHRHVSARARRPRQRRLLPRRAARRRWPSGCRRAGSRPAASSAPTCSITSGASRRGFRPTSTTST